MARDFHYAWAAKSELKPPARVALVVLCVFASMLCIWPMFGVLWILIFGLNFGSFKRQALWYSLAAAAYFGFDIAYTLFTGGGPLPLYELGVFLPLLPLAMYNGKKASPRAPVWTTNKWIFYVIYPLHLAVLGFLQYGLAGQGIL